ncbi:Aste57867_13942 [Aphanomyces stellatus]|uniref:Aste57867_13942 protein n=1 Tax=Aphanomyces stellatus TaxID=120398 RepID=A0A485KZQ9_9STRA|nr:hypothetical protein As57867_013891 [Aphanomyces stellatus]VFT90772.1 Aste57867_13942 [Aphanomyces stellatus]
MEKDNDGGSGGDVETALVLGDVNLMLQRREYFRKKQRNHRRKERDEVLRLQSQVAEMEAVAAHLRKITRGVVHPVDADGMLSWHTVAATFRQESRLCVTEKENLLDRVRMHRALATEMQRWVGHSQATPLGRSILWHHLSLCAHPDARKLAKEWATQQMYHNTAAVFLAFPDVPPDQEFSTIDVDVVGPWMHVSDLSQYRWDAPLEVTTFMFRHHMAEIFKRDFTSTELTENTVLYHGVVAETGKEDMMLQAHFAEADRCVIVLRQVQADELRADGGVSLSQDQMLIWFDLRRDGPTRTVARVTNRGLMNLTAAGFATLDAFAAKVGLDLSATHDQAEKEAAFRRWTRNHVPHQHKAFQGHVQVVLARVQADLARRATG